MTNLAMNGTGSGGSSVRLSTDGRRSDAEWVAFFSTYSHIVLVANSDEQAVEDIRADYPETALFVFFNRVNKVLKTPFSGNSLLVTRSNQAGSELVYRNILGTMVALLPPPGFAGVLNLRVVTFEHLMEPAEFGNVPAGRLDLASYFDDFYPPDHTASSGFALAVWLCEKVRDVKVVLTGFSARRSDRWKLFHIHDWTFEQSVMHLLAANGRLDLARQRTFNPYKALAAHFPDIDASEVNFATAQVLSRRLEDSNRHIDKLISITSPLRLLYDGFKALKRKSKKERLLAKRLKMDEKT